MSKNIAVFPFYVNVYWKISSYGARFPERLSALGLKKYITATMVFYLLFCVNESWQIYLYGARFSQRISTIGSKKNMSKNILLFIFCVNGFYKICF